MTAVDSLPTGEYGYNSNEQENEAETSSANTEDQSLSTGSDGQEQNYQNDSVSPVTNKLEDIQGTVDNENPVSDVQQLEEATPTEDKNDEIQDEAIDTTQDNLNEAANATSENTEDDTVADVQTTAQETANVEDNAAEVEDDASATIPDSTVPENSSELDDSAQETVIATEGEQSQTTGEEKPVGSETSDQTKSALDSVAAPIARAVKQGMEALTEAASSAAAATEQFVHDVQARLAAAANGDQVKPSDETETVEGETVAAVDAQTVTTTVQDTTKNTSLDSGNTVVTSPTTSSQPSTPATISADNAPRVAPTTQMASGSQPVTTATTQAAPVTPKANNKGAFASVSNYLHRLFNTAAQAPKNRQKTNTTPQTPPPPPETTTTTAVVTHNSST